MAVSVASKTAVKKVKSASVSYHIMFWLALALIAAFVAYQPVFLIDFDWNWSLFLFMHSSSISIISIFFPFM
ncbi:MAG: hypothetical protein IPH36_12420 [Saprospiraceae bacterium]|nr:hypothetical protein [Saprospiraceae bacterium]